MIIMTQIDKWNRRIINSDVSQRFGFDQFRVIYSFVFSGYFIIHYFF